jgi:hypothetical protein
VPAQPSPSTAPSEDAPPAAARSRVLRRVDEQGVKHYVIEPLGDEDSSSAEPAPSAFSASAAPRAAAQRAASASALPSASASEALPDASAPLPAVDAIRPAPEAPAPREQGYTVLADSEGTAAAIRELEIQIARDRETLKQMISETAPGGPNPAEDPRLREIAARLPRLQAELEALRRESRP